MKKWITLILAACLLLACTAALAEAADTAAQENAGTSLPGPEAIAEAVEAEGAEAPAEEAIEADASEADASEADAAEAEAPGEAFTLWFEEGFCLSILEGWVSYPVSEADAEAGLRYALGDGTGEHFLYIEAQAARNADIEAVSRRIEADAAKEKTGDLVLGETPFVAFIDAENDAGGCSTVWNGEIVSFLFVPQSDSAYMLTATELMETFTTL